MIPRNPKKKAADRAAFRVKSLRVSNQRHENLLRHVFRQSHVSAHMQRKAINRWMPPAVKQRERLFIARDHPPEQQTVAHQLHLALHLMSFDGWPRLSLHIPPRTPKSSPILPSSRLTPSLFHRNGAISRERQSPDWCLPAVVGRLRLDSARKQLRSAPHRIAPAVFRSAGVPPALFGSPYRSPRSVLICLENIHCRSFSGGRSLSSDKKNRRAAPSFRGAVPASSRFCGSPSPGHYRAIAVLDQTPALE